MSEYLQISLHQGEVYYAKELDFLHFCPPHPTTHIKKNLDYK